MKLLIMCLMWNTPLSVILWNALSNIQDFQCLVYFKYIINKYSYDRKKEEEKEKR